MSALDHIATQPLGQCKLGTAANMSELGERRVYGLIYASQFFTLFKATSSTYAYIREWRQEKCIVIRAINATGAAISPGAALLYDATNNYVYQADSEAATADSGAFMGVAIGMWMDYSNAATSGPTVYTTPQDIPSLYHFDLCIGGVVEAETVSSPTQSYPAITTTTAGKLGVAGASSLNPVGRFLTASSADPGYALVRLSNTLFSTGT